MDYNDRLFAYDNLFPNGQMKLSIGEIFQVSELSVIRGGEISTHRQQCDEITYAIQGSARFFSDDSCDTLKAGQLHFIKKDSVHKIEVLADENFRFICIGFLPNCEDNSVKAFYSTLKNKSHFIANDNGTVKTLTEFLIREFYNSDEFSHDMINKYISQILTTISRILSGKAYDYHKASGEKSANYALYKMLRYIDREYMHIKSVKQVSEALSFSEYYLSHLFKEKMGVTIKEYLTKKKIAYAGELLITTKLTIEKISEQLGFSSSHSFRRSFKQYMGLAPSEYKKTT